MKAIRAHSSGRLAVAVAMAVAVVAWPSVARAQAGDAGVTGATQAADAGAEPSSADAAADAAPAVAPPAQEPLPAQLPSQNGAPGVEGAATEPEPAPPARRTKPLRVTTGLPPTSVDLGSEADIVNAADEKEAVALLRKWTFSLRGFFRAPLRVGFGPRVDGTPGTELHSPPRIPGLSSGDWNYIAVAPNPSTSVYVAVSNPMLSAHVILSADPQQDAAYPDLAATMGWASQAYLTFKFPTVFGSYGGLAWTVGSFATRYGTAGPASTGYYGTYLFGKTHVAGEALTADVDLSDHLELVVEHGFGAKLEVVPFITTNTPTLPKADFIQGQGPLPLGSNFAHHAHAALIFDERIKLGGHWMTSFSPNDHSFGKGPVPESRITVVGGDLHVDMPVGNGYIGYSHVKAENLLPLSGAIQLLHSSDGYSLKKNFFGRKDRVTQIEPTNDSGTVDTILFQYILKLATLLDAGPDLNLGVYGMFNHVRSPNPGDVFGFDINQNKLKLGAEIELGVFRFMSLGFRFDRVAPDLSDKGSTYSALSPRAILYSKVKSKEYIIVDYTHFVLGPGVFPSSPYQNALQADPDILAVSAVMSL